MADDHSLQPVTDQPYNAETPLSALSSKITPTDLFYVRNHFDVPLLDESDYRLKINGDISKPIELSLAQLKRFPEKSMIFSMECAGNGRSGMKPKIKGTPWNLGAISQANFSGTALRDVLAKVELPEGVSEILFTGGDRGKVHSGETENYARSLPVEIAYHPDTMLVWEMNGEELAPSHGYPLRLIVPGWYGMASVKWLSEITPISEPFQGIFQTQEYVYVGEADVPDNTPVTTMRVRSLITNPENNSKLSSNTITLTGIAWSGDGKVEQVQLSFDDGKNWLNAELQPARSNYEFSSWSYKWHPERMGDWSIISRAADSVGNIQPFESIWNKGGYGNNAVHIIHLTIK